MSGMRDIKLLCQVLGKRIIETKAANENSVLYYISRRKGTSPGDMKTVLECIGVEFSSLDASSDICLKNFCCNGIMWMVKQGLSPYLLILLQLIVIIATKSEASGTKRM